MYYLKTSKLHKMLKININNSILLLIPLLLTITSCQFTTMNANDDINTVNNTIGYDDSSLNNNVQDFGNLSNDPNQTGYIYDNSSDANTENTSDNNYDISLDNGSTSGIYYSLDQPVNTLSLPPSSSGNLLYSSMQDPGTSLSSFPSTSVNQFQPSSSSISPSLSTSPVPNPTNYQVSLYIFQIIGSNTPSVPCYFDQNSLTFWGCNVYSVPYNAGSSGKFKSSNSQSKTKKSCSTNIDSQYIKALSSGNSFKKYSKGFYITNGMKQICRFVGPIKSQQKPITQSINSFMSNIPQGNYKFNIVGSNLPSINTLIGSKGFSFTGCNSFSLLCSYASNGIFKAGNPISSTKKQCSNNNDPKYLQCFKDGNSITRSGNNFYITKHGNKSASFQLIKPNQKSTFSFNLNKQQFFKPGKALPFGIGDNQKLSINTKPSNSIINKPINNKQSINNKLPIVPKTIPSGSSINKKRNDQKNISPRSSTNGQFGDQQTIPSGSSMNNQFGDPKTISSKSSMNKKRNDQKNIPSGSSMNSQFDDSQTIPSGSSMNNQFDSDDNTKSNLFGGRSSNKNLSPNSKSTGQSPTIGKGKNKSISAATACGICAAQASKSQH